mgnify:CR=1 FL=1
MKLLKWIVAAMVAAFAWLVIEYTVEYFRPYKHIEMNRS